MTDVEYHDRLDDLYVDIEEALDDFDDFIEYETASGMVTIACQNGSKVIVSRQPPLHQLWLAAKSGGFHFDLKDGKWVDNKSGEVFEDSLSRCIEEQSGIAISFEF